MPIKAEDDLSYHSGEGVSKSRLFKLETKTPFHAQYGARKETPALTLGKAAHCAILEPETFEHRFTLGPEARGNSNEWKHAEDFARHAGTTLLKPKDYEQAMLIRDLAATVPELDLVREGQTIIETSAYHMDEEHQVLVKTRPDLYNVNHGLICDIKNMADASETAFQRDVGKFGYHMQHALYSEIWENGAGMPVNGFFFVVFEKSEPPMVAVYELSASAIAEGYAMYRAALAKYAECMRADEWPGYPTGVKQIGLKRWDYRYTQPPEGDEDQFPAETDDDAVGEDEPEETE